MKQDLEEFIFELKIIRNILNFKAEVNFLLKNIFRVIYQELRKSNNEADLICTYS